MKLLLPKLLAHFCSLLIAAPVGWCCGLPRVDVCEDAEESACCCCEKNKQSAPSKPERAPYEEPTCCQAVPAVLLKSSAEIDSAGSDVLPAPPLPVAATTDDALQITSRPLLTGRSPPLHVLYCIWLC